MPTLTSISNDATGRFIGADNTGQVWRGELKRDRSGGGEYIDWKPVRSEFHER
jgi:hypothetical protein